jgi:hypothetical protein
MSQLLQRVVAVISTLSLVVIAAAGLALFIGVTRPTSVLQGVQYVAAALAVWLAFGLFEDLQSRVVRENPLGRRVLERTKANEFVSPLRIGYLLLAALVTMATIGLVVWGLIWLAATFGASHVHR